jgi:prepilin-type N-terminal cleavage/methylation domain-containing protein
MQNLRSFGKSPRPVRAGFTMIELLVVLAIIAVLLSLSVAGVMSFIGSQRVSNSKTALNKVTFVLKANWNSVAEQAARDWTSNPATRSKYSSIVTALGAPSTNPGLQKVMYVKLKLVQTFPVSFDEVLVTPSSANMLPALTLYTKKLGSAGLNISGSNSTTGPYESSALLLMALQEGISGQKLNIDDLGNATVGTVSAGNGTLPYLADAWGSPISFFRWPTGSTDLNLGGAQAGTNHDLTDPQGLLTSTTWLSSATNVSNFQAAIGYTPPQQGASGALSYTLVPLLVSPGPDLSLGMNSGSVNTGIDPNATPDGTGKDADNISSASQ